MMRVVVTGGLGFIGSSLCVTLLGAGHQVAVVDKRLAQGQGSLPPTVQGSATDIRDPDLSNVLAGLGCDVVIHLAAQTSVARSIHDPLLDATTNVIGTINVVEAAARAGAKRIVSCSSAAVYGLNSNCPINEDEYIDPISPYGLSKMTAEAYTRMLAERWGMSHAIIRPANVYGPGQSAEGEAGVVAIFMRAALSGQRPMIQGDGLQTRDFVYVDDVADAFRLAAESSLPGAIWNVGSGTQTTILALWETICTVTEQVGIAQSDANREPIFGLPRPGDIRESCLAVGRLSAALGWRATTRLQTGLRLAMQTMQPSCGEAV